MSIPVKCPSCSAKMNAPDAAAGKRVKCPKCAAAILVPAVEDDIEIVDDEPRRPVKSQLAKKNPVAVEEDDEDEDDRPRKKSRRRQDDEEDDEDDHPRKKKAASKKKGGIPIWVFALAGAAALAVVGVIAVVVLTGGKPGALGGPGGVLGASTPAGYTAVCETDGGFAVFLPGEAKKVQATMNGQNVAELGHHGWSRVNEIDGKQASAWSRTLPQGGFVPATDAAALMQLLRQHDNYAWADSPSTEMVSQRAITLGGKPGLEVKYKEKARLMGKPGDDGFFKETDRKELDRVAKEGRHTVVYITHDGKKVYIISVSQKLAFPANDELKIVADSFSLL